MMSSLAIVVITLVNRSYVYPVELFVMKVYFLVNTNQSPIEIYFYQPDVKHVYI